MKKIVWLSFRKRRIFFFACCCALCILLCLKPSITQGEKVKRVFLLCSYHQGNPRGDQIVQGVFSVLGEKEAETHVEYLDSERHNEKEILAHFRSLLKAK
jgi:hypothetical protein